MAGHPSALQTYLVRGKQKQTSKPPTSTMPAKSTNLTTISFQVLYAYYNEEKPVQRETELIKKVKILRDFTECF